MARRVVGAIRSRVGPVTGRPGRGAFERVRLAGSGRLAIVAVLVLLGVAGSALAARAVARTDAQDAEHARAANAANVVSRLQLALQHEEDLVVDVGAFIVANPHPSNAEFNAWLAGARAYARYPEVLGIARIVVVPAAELPAFAARAQRDPSGSLGPNGSFRVIPAGTRPFYCFIEEIGKGPLPVDLVPAGTDYCAGTYRRGLLSGRDTGHSAYQPYSVANLSLLAIQTPVYRGGVTPATVAARRAAFVGWLGLAVQPGVLLKTALAGQPHTAVVLSYSRGGSAASFRAGKAPPGATSLVADLHNGWTVRTFAAGTSRSPFSHTNSLLALVGGSVLSMLLGVLAFVLVTGRERAVRLVQERTVELRSQSEKLRLTIDELRAAQAIKDEFIGLVSHELRTPLTSIKGFTELLQDEDLTDEQRTYLEVVAANSERLLALVNDLLLMAQIQSGGVPLEVGEVMLAELVAHSSEAAKPLAASKQIDVDVDLDRDVATQGDRERLGQVIDNLLSNAIKYTPSGGTVSITMRRQGETATIAVADSGIGIPAEEQEKLFDRFFRTSNARASGVQGTGLGLAISRGIVEAHGGTIDFDSVEGMGTTFRVTLPHAHRIEVPA